jgi:predicted ester cyclase
MSSVEMNKQIVRRIHDGLASRCDLSVADEVYTPDVRTSRRPTRPPGPAGVKQHITMLRAAFPDLQVTVEDLIAEADRVVARLSMTGTHSGDFRGRAPTGRSVTWTGIVIYRLSDGRVVEQWSQFDTRALIEQIEQATSEQ